MRTPCAQHLFNVHNQQSGQHGLRGHRVQYLVVAMVNSRVQGGVLAVRVLRRRRNRNRNDAAICTLHRDIRYNLFITVTARGQHGAHVQQRVQVVHVNEHAIVLLVTVLVTIPN